MDKATLREYRAIAAEADELEAEIARLRDKAEARTWPDGQPRSNYAADRTADIVAQIADVCGMLDKKRADLFARLREIEEAIEGLESDERRVIRLRYIKGLSWERVCVEANYSWRQAHYIHSQALRKIAHFCTQ